MAILPAVPVAAPEPRGIRYGLLAAAAGPLDLPPHARGGGVQYEPVSCGVARLYPVECPDGADVKVFDDNDPLIDADPFVVYASLVCGSVGYTPAELEAKVKRRLANGEQGAAELGLANALAAAGTPTVDVADPTDIVAVVAALEEWLYGEQGYGHWGVLHAPARVAAYAANDALIVQDGPLKRTPYGTVWSIGGGYSGALPGGSGVEQQRTLVGEFYEFPGGPAVDLVGTPTLTVTPLAGGAPVVGPTTVGVAHPSTGVYTYLWAGGTPGVDYLVDWEGVDGDGDTVHAKEIRTVPVGEIGTLGLYITGHTTVWRSPDVHVFPAAQVFDRETNQYGLIAEREYVVAYDCLAAGAPVAAEVESS